jgi:hypothetical protein
MTYDPKYSVREPNIEDATNLIGAILRSAGADTLREVMSGFGETENEDERNLKASEGFVMLLLDALSNPTTRDDLLFILGDMWQYDPGKVDDPPDFFEYAPDPAAVARGQAFSREERWRALSTRNRKRLVKRQELGQLPLGALIEFVNAFKETVNLGDFLESLRSLAPAKAGESETSSQDDTDGQTD